MSLPLGFARKEEHHVCKLMKHGLKQASQQWYSKVSKFMAINGFIQSKCDYSLFSKHSIDFISIVLVYVDDIIVASNNLLALIDFKASLNKKFKIIYLDMLKYFLGLEVVRPSKGIFLYQTRYGLKILSDTGKLGTKAVNFPMDPNLKLSKIDAQLLDDPTTYRSLVGCLL